MATDDTILEELNENFTNDTNEWQDIYDEGTTDLQVLSGDVWNALDPEGAKQRREAKRMMIAPDELGQYINQVVNDVRSNARGIVFSPTGDGASAVGADFYQNKTREIEYRSHASRAYTTAFENSVQRGFGYVRVESRHIHSALFDPDTPASVEMMNQELWISEVVNPNLIIPDPYAQRSDLGDMQRCFVLEWRPVADFRRKWPDAKIQNFTPSAVSTAQAQWFTPDRKQILTAEYWSIERLKTRELLVLKPGPRTALNPSGNPIALWADELQKRPSSDAIMQSRKVPINAVKQRITNGLEILETNDWDGKYIPITGCFGKILYVDDGQGAKKKILSMTRLAREPFLAYAYLWSSELEIVGMTPKFPYFFYEGSLSPDMMTLLAKSLYEPVAAISVRPTVPGVTSAGGVLPVPQRNPYDGSSLQYVEIAKEAARRAIQAAMGITPLPTPVQRENQKSGKALQQIESSGQRGSFHFVDSYDSMIRQVGVILEDKMDHTYDTARQTAVYNPSTEGTSIATINTPTDPNSVNTKGDYQVTISVGPATDNQRVEASAFVDTLAQNLPTIAQVAGPPAAKKVLAESIRLKRLGQIGDRMADAIDPPPNQSGQPTPQQIQQMGQENQQLKAALGQAQQALQADTIKYTAQKDIEGMKLAADRDLQIELKRMDIAGKVEAARITASKQSADLQAEATEEAIALGLNHAHEATQANLDRAHDVGMAAMDHNQNLEAGQQDTAQQALLASQAHGQNMEAQAAQPPTPGTP